MGSLRSHGPTMALRWRRRIVWPMVLIGVLLVLLLEAYCAGGHGRH